MVASLEQAQDFVADIIPNIRDIFEKDGELRPVSFIGAQINPETGQPFDFGDKIAVIVITPETLGISMKNSQGVQQYTNGLRKLSKLCKAIMVVTVMEAWILKLPKGEGREKLPKSLEHAPGREECVQIMMEHHKLNGKVMMWGASITRDEQNNGILEEFTEPVTIDGTGRFLGMVESPS